MITTKIIFDRRGWCKQKKKGIVEVRVTSTANLYIQAYFRMGSEWST